MADEREATIATIALRQVRVPRGEVDGDRASNVMNRLVPYLDLFARLSDEEMSRLAQVPLSVVGNLRAQVVQVDRALERYSDLLPRLDDKELVRLTSATAKTVRFWRLCQPRSQQPNTSSGTFSVARAAERLAGSGVSAVEQTSPRGEPLESGSPVGRDANGKRHPSGETVEAARHPSGETKRHPSGETPGVPAPLRNSSADRSAPYIMPDEERDGGPRRRVTGDITGPRQVAQVDESGFAETAAAVAARTRGTDVTHPDLAQKHKAVADQIGLSGTPFPGYDSEASGTHEDGIFIGLELPDPRPMPPGRGDQG